MSDKWEKKMYNEKVKRFSYRQLKINQINMRQLENGYFL